MTTVSARILFAGEAEADVLRLDEPLSFWGGFDPLTGVMLDNNHPQKGLHLSRKALVMPATRGSGGTPGGVAEAICAEIQIHAPGRQRIEGLLASES